MTLAPPETIALQARGLTCRRGGRLLFSHLDLTLHAGRMLWLRGDNGRGKSSLLRLLAGVVAVEEGSVRWFGHAARTTAAAAVQPAWVSHANALKDDLTVTESLAFLADLDSHGPASTAHASPAHGAIADALARFGLTRSHDALVRTLSQGQRRRVALARLALVPSTRTWLLDEPFDALDAPNTAVLNGLLREHLQRGGSVMLTSHQSLGDDAPDAGHFWLQAPGRAQATASGDQVPMATA